MTATFLSLDFFIDNAERLSQILVENYHLEKLKEPFFWMSNAIGWTNPRKLSCVCRMITRVCALESLWSKLTSEYPSYGLATSRKFSAGVWNFVRRKLGVSKTAKNHRFQTLRRYIGKNRRFLQLKHKNGAAQATMKTPSDELR